MSATVTAISLTVQPMPGELLIQVRYWMRYRDHSGRERIMLAAHDDGGIWYALSLPELSFLRSGGYPRRWGSFEGLRLSVEAWLTHWHLSGQGWHAAERYMCLLARERMED